MELILGIVIFGLLLAIAVIGLVRSTRRAEGNDASRHALAGRQTVHPAEQQSRLGAAMSHPGRPGDPSTPDRLA